MSDLQNPQERSQGILDSTTVGRDLSARDITQKSNTTNTFITVPDPQKIENQVIPQSKNQAAQNSTQKFCR